LLMALGIRADDLNAFRRCAERMRIWRAAFITMVH
jgi:hypothetical protein